jgi:hypothetical protein
MFAQVRMFLRTVSVAVRVPGRESSRGHGAYAENLVRPGGSCRSAGVAMFWFRLGCVASSSPEVCKLRHDDRLCCCDWSTSA